MQLVEGNEDPLCGYTEGRVTLNITCNYTIVCYRKPRDDLISQSNVCESLVGPMKGQKLGNKARVA